jgi:serine/threonine protein phosphatase PrpC
MTSLRAGAATDVGRVRANNQDQLLVAEPLFAVADGMGGHAAGEVASETALDALHRVFAATETRSPESVRSAVRSANRAVWDAAESREELRGMGTTLTGVALVPSDDGEVVAVVNVGDSRTYRMRAGELTQITADHSLVAELVAEGRIRPEEAETHPQRHVLTRALGVYPDVDVDLLTFEPRVGDRYLLCSDGLSREVTDAQVASVLRRLDNPQDAARELVDMARENGGSDNITVVLVDIILDPAEAPDGPLDGSLHEDGPPTALIPAVVIANGAGPPSAAPPADASPADAPPADAPPADAPPSAPGDSRRTRRRAAKAAKGPKVRLVTIRVVGFFVLLLAIVGAGLAGTAWYARESYFVGVRSGQILIFKGRPGGVLWWQPTVASDPSLTVNGVEAHNLPALTAGVEESSLGAARLYVHNLQAEKAAATPTTTVTAPTTTTTTTTPKSTTTVHHRTTHHKKSTKPKKHKAKKKATS